MGDVYRKHMIFRVSGYEVEEKMEQMNYVGNVFRCVSVDGIQYMIKYGNKEQLSYEFSIELSCEGLLKQINFFEDHDFAAIVYEYPSGGKTLKDVVDESDGQIPESTIKAWFFDILQSLRDLHDNRLYHNNLCLENAFICMIVGENHIKITGMKEYKKLSPAESKLFTSDYSFNPGIPPEQLDGLPRIRTSDVWSLGIMLYYIMNKSYPFGTTKEDLNNLISNYKVKGILPSFKYQYSNELVDIIKKMLIYNCEKRLNPHQLLALPYFRYLMHPPFQMMDKVIKTRDAPRYKIFAGENMYKIGTIINIGPEKVSMAFPYDSADPREVSLNIDQLEHCTDTRIEDGIIPLTVGTKVIRGEDWDDDTHGNNDESGPGTVISIIPCNGEKRDFIAVAVKWPFTGRVVRYFYGLVNLLLKTEVIPAYPPILPGMIVKKGPHTEIDFKEGFIASVAPTKDEAVVRIGDTDHVLPYGKENKFGFIIDPSYYENTSINSVDVYLKNIEGSTDDFFFEETIDDSYNVQLHILDEYRKKKDAYEVIVSPGMFVHIPNRKDIIFARIKQINDDDTINAIGNTGRNLVYLTNFPANNLLQCSYGTVNDHPVCLGDKVVTKVGGQSGSVVYIGNNDSLSTEGKKIASWKYVVIQSDPPSNQLQCFHFNELKVTKTNAK